MKSLLAAFLSLDGPLHTVDQAVPATVTVGSEHRVEQCVSSLPSVEALVLLEALAS